MKNKYQHFLLMLLTLVVITSSVNAQKCGYVKFNQGIIDYNLCNNFLNQDTIKAEILNKNMEPTWSEIDGVKFNLPNGYKIVGAKLSTVITPSLWPNMNENVIQYQTFDDFSILCKDVKKLQANDNIIMHPMELNQQQIIDNYFSNATEIHKDQLVNYLNKVFDKEKKYLTELKPDKIISAKDIKKDLLENERTRKVYLKYLNNFTTMKNAPREIFDLLTTIEYLTLTIENNNKTKEVTLEYFPIHGN
jgi:hypothetical protein